MCRCIYFTFPLFKVARSITKNLEFSVQGFAFRSEKIICVKNELNEEWGLLICCFWREGNQSFFGVPWKCFCGLFFSSEIWISYKAGGIECWHTVEKSRGPLISQTEVQILSLTLARCVDLAVYGTSPRLCFSICKMEISTISKSSYEG